MKDIKLRIPLRPLGLLCLPLLAGSIFLAWNLQLNLQKRQVGQQIASGAQVCFNRVGQSFTAMMLGQSRSRYLGADFFQSTSECFGQVQSLLEQNNFSSEMLASSNQVARKVNSFHNSLSLLENNEVSRDFASLERNFKNLRTQFSKSNQDGWGEVEELKEFLVLSLGLSVLFALLLAGFIVREIRFGIQMHRAVTSCGNREQANHLLKKMFAYFQLPDRILQQVTLGNLANRPDVEVKEEATPEQGGAKDSPDNTIDESPPILESCLERLAARAFASGVSVRVVPSEQYSEFFKKDPDGLQQLIYAALDELIRHLRYCHFLTKKWAVISCQVEEQTPMLVINSNLASLDRTTIATIESVKNLAAKDHEHLEPGLSKRPFYLTAVLAKELGHEISIESQHSSEKLKGVRLVLNPNAYQRRMQQRAKKKPTEESRMKSLVRLVKGKKKDIQLNA